MPRHSPCALISFTICFMFYEFSLKLLISQYIVVFYPIILSYRFKLVVSSFALLFSLFCFQASFSVPKNRFQRSTSIDHSNPFLGFWWAQMDSNHRPHAYQACALTTWAMRPTFWWRWGGSNSWPSACKADALPAELHPQLFLFQSAVSTASSKLNNIQDDPCWPKFKAVSLYTP